MDDLAKEVEVPKDPYIIIFEPIDTLDESLYRNCTGNLASQVRGKATSFILDIKLADVYHRASKVGAYCQRVLKIDLDLRPELLDQIVDLAYRIESERGNVDSIDEWEDEIKAEVDAIVTNFQNR